MKKHSIVVTARSDNAKTGDVPTVWVGATLEQSRESCRGCALLERGCYAQHGQVAIGMRSIERARRADRAAKAQGRAPRGTVLSPKAAIDAAVRGRRKTPPRLLRVSALGDAARANVGQLDAAIVHAKRRGLAIVGYTHFWAHADGSWLRGLLMASCNNLDELALAERLGWRATVIMPTGTTGTLRRADGSILAVECPAIAAGRIGKKYTCNDCASSRRGALCDASKPGPHVYFAEHGAHVRRLKVVQ